MQVNKRVAVGISGGVDSAVSALLLKKAGYDVTGVHLYCWPPISEVEKDGLSRREWIKKNGCRADEDRASALKTCLEIGIPFKVLDFSEEYNARVIKYFYEEYEAGRTPNPDVLCNSEIKFGLFLDWALRQAQGKPAFDYIATGHYAKIGRPQGTAPTVSLMIPKDKHKDQTYFLWKLTQKELSKAIFPLGELVKGEVRAMAKEAGLSVADKKDSQGICFVGNVEVREFLARRLKEKQGRVLDTEGNNVGTHDGVSFYTIGQRGGWRWDPKAQNKVAQGHGATVSRGIIETGLPRSARNDENVTPIYYVISKDAKTNTLVVGEAGEAVEDQFEVGEINLIGGVRLPRRKLLAMTNIFVRIRHGGELLRARTQELKNSRNQVTGVCVVLDKAVRGIASGQSAVFYDGEGECLGGGVIV